MEPLLLYGISAIMALVMPMVILVAVACSPVAALLTANQARAKGRSPLPYAFLGAAYCVLLLLPWIALMLRISGSRAATIVNVVMYVCVAALVLIMTVAWYLLFDGGADWVLGREQSMSLMVVLGSVVVISAVSLLIYHHFANLYMNSSERALHPAWHAFGEILYLTPFALVIVNVSIFWLVLADSISSLY